MIKFEQTGTYGWSHAIRGMRNPKNSWDRMDSVELCPQYEWSCHLCGEPDIGPNDMKLMDALNKGGPVHAKYRRMIVVYVDITAPLYWWKQYDTYKVGTVENSCSTMHKIHAKPFEMSDFSLELLEGDDPLLEFCRVTMENVIKALNSLRDKYNVTGNKMYWDVMIQMLPDSYNQKRTLMLNYEVLHNIYTWRRNHKLGEWHDFCDWIEHLPYSELITNYTKGE